MPNAQAIRDATIEALKRQLAEGRETGLSVTGIYRLETVIEKIAKGGGTCVLVYRARRNVEPSLVILDYALGVQIADEFWGYYSGVARFPRQRALFSEDVTAYFGRFDYPTKLVEGNPL